MVIINVNSNYVEYRRKKDLLIPLLYTSEIHEQTLRHYQTSKDIYAAFQRLIIEEEAPAIIIADLLNDHNKSDRDRE